MKSSITTTSLAGVFKMRFPLVIRTRKTRSPASNPTPRNDRLPRFVGSGKTFWLKSRLPLTSKYSIFVLSSRLTSVKTAPKPVDRCSRGVARHEIEYLYDVTVQSREKPLGAEGTEELRKGAMDVAKTDRGVSRVIAIGAHLETRPGGEEDNAPRGIGVKEVGWEIVWG